MGISAVNSTFILPVSATDPTITKTIIVKGSNGALLSNALVAVGYQDPSDTKDANHIGINWAWTTPIATNEHGEAVISGLPQNAGSFTELYIEPAIGSTDAMYYANPSTHNFTLAASETLNITLKAATFFVSLFDSAGQPAPIHTGYAFPQFTDPTTHNLMWVYINILRQGIFGAYVDPTVANGPTYFQAWDFSKDNANNPEAMVNYSMDISSASLEAPKTVAFSNAYTGDTVNLDGTDHSYHFSLLKTSFKHQIVAPDSSTPLDRAYLVVCFDGSNKCWGMTGADGRVGLPDGEWKIMAMSDAPGNTFATQDYTAVVTDGGVHTQMFYGYPKTDTQPHFDKTSNTWKLNMALANISGSILGTDGPITLGSGQGFSIETLKWVGDHYEYQPNGSWSNGNYAITFHSAGKYLIEISPHGLSGYTTTRSKEIVVTDAGGGSFKVSYDGAAAVTSLTKDLTLAVPNLRMMIKNPIDTLPLSNGWVSVESVTDSGNTSWVTNAVIYSESPGIATAQLNPGTYRLRVNPPGGSQSIPGLAQRAYTAVISNTEPKIKIYNGTDTSGTALTAESGGEYVLNAGAANVTGKFVDSSGAGIGSGVNNKWVNVCLQSLMPNGIDWNYLSCTNTTSDGHFNVMVSDPGTYRLLFEPQGRTDIAITTTDSFVVPNPVGDFNKLFVNVVASSPSMKVKVREVGGTVDLQWSGIEVRKNNQFLFWANTGNTALVAISLPSAGTYQFVVHPPNGGTSGLSTNKSYTVNAISTSGKITATVDGVAPDSSGITTLTLGTATLSGHVYAPDGTTAQWNSQIVATEKSTGNQLWQYGSSTNQEGFWSMFLPAGTYTMMAQTPWGSSTFGNSDQMGDVIVGSDGAVSFAGMPETITATTFNINLKNPRWSGTIKGPTGETSLANARVCLHISTPDPDGWACSQTDATGHWSMSAPTGFTSLSDSSELRVEENQNPRYSTAIYRGLSAIEAAGFISAGASSIVLRLPAPNLAITVMAGSSPASNMWVNINDPVYGTWLGAGATNSLGIAGFNVDLSAGGPLKTHGIMAQINTSNNSEISATYAATTKTFDATTFSGVTDSATVTVALSTPNIRGILTDPATSQPVANTWIELFDTTNNKWMGGSNTDQNGFFSISAPGNTSGPTNYNVTANPGYNATSTSSKNIYLAVVGADGTLSSFRSSKTLETPTTTTYLGAPAYAVLLAPASVTGVVKDPAGNVLSNSWVVPFDATNNNQLWQNGANTKSLGQFSLALPDGGYRIQANVPYGSSSLASSAMCSVTIAANAVTSATSGCVKEDKSLVLKLRGPNLSITVLKSDGLTPVPYANVGVGLGNWNTWAQTDSRGRASLFIDSAQISTSNNGQLNGPQNYSIWVDPPYGSSDAVRTSCYSGETATACAGLAQVNVVNVDGAAYENSTASFTLQAPNTHITIKTPGGVANVHAGGWINLFNIVGGNWQWLASAPTDSNGLASFNILDTATATAMVVQIDPPWDQKNLYSGKTYDGIAHAGLSWSDVNGNSFNLVDPNLKLTVKTHDRLHPASSSWVSVERTNASDSPIEWIGGTGLSSTGSASFMLPDTSTVGERIKIIAHPGVEQGVDTVCFVTVESGVVSNNPSDCNGSTVTGGALTLWLATGNITGTVTASVSGETVTVSGAIVYANVVDDPDGTPTQSTDPATEIVTSTDSLGNYDLQLDTSKTWYIKIIPVNTPADIAKGKKFATKTIAGVKPPVLGQNTKNATLENL